MILRTILLGVLLGLTTTSCKEAEAEAEADKANDGFPRKPVKIVVPFGPGGDSDTFTRIIQKAVEDHDLLPEPLVVVNVPGAGGTIGSRRVRNAAPDGHTILNLHEGIFTSKYAGRVTYGPEAFRPIAATAESNLVICVRDDSRFQQLDDLLKAAAEKPDSILFGMAPGTPTHFAGRRLESAGGKARFRMVPSGGGSKRRHDLIGKHIDVTPFSLSEFIGFEGSGVRAIGYLAAERHPSLREVPTARELGYDVVMPHVHYWWAPKSTPDAVIKRIADMLEAAIATDYVRGKLAETKTEPLFLRDKELEAHLASREGEFQDVALVQYEGLPDPVGPVIVLILAIGTWISVRGFNNKEANKDSPFDWRHALLTLAILTGYLISMQWLNIPYPIATMIFIPVLAMATGARSPGTILKITGIGIATAWGCFFIFTKFLVIDLP
jgi:tripartite-type tricarboxylate transporter receptor subunit TctC